MKSNPKCLGIIEMKHFDWPDLNFYLFIGLSVHENLRFWLSHFGWETFLKTLVRQENSFQLDYLPQYCQKGSWRVIFVTVPQYSLQSLICTMVQLSHLMHVLWHWQSRASWVWLPILLYQRQLHPRWWHCNRVRDEPLIGTYSCSTVAFGNTFLDAYNLGTIYIYIF